MQQSVLNFNVKPNQLFFGSSGHGVSRYDIVRYPILDKLNEKMQSFFWRPQEIDMSQERRSFNSMSDVEQFVFTENLKRQILLDSIQGRAPALVFLPYCSDPMLENCLLTWSFFESIHSQSYTHIIRAIFSDPQAVIDEMPNIQAIADCAHDITTAYDEMVLNPSKENLYLALIAANALEAIRFYVSFACTFSFNERALVEGSGKIVKLIARDEIQHLAFVQHILKLLPKDDPEFIQIIGDNRDKAIQIIDSACDQEKDWGNYLFKDGSIIGLNEGIICDTVDFFGIRTKRNAGLITDTTKLNHPIPWIEKHLNSHSMQVAPQEAEIASYLASSVKNDMADIDFSKIW
jgi:ribonucleoside-diphosphate reductase beta chain